LGIPLLEIKQLSVGFRTDRGVVKAIDKITLKIDQGETICIVGESGSGKSVTSLSAMRLIEYENGTILEGQIFFNGENLLSKTTEEIRKIRGGQMAMIFQEPMTALNPVFTIGKQIVESILLHEDTTPEKARTRAVDLLRLVGMSEPNIRANQYPHELSGGMKQRAMIAMALACNPKLLIADEPTTALDVTIQSQILNLLQDLKSQMNMSILLITHDMGVAAEMADRVVVMYAGKIMEEATVYEIFDRPMHPYTIGLLQSIPPMEGERGGQLKSIDGTIPSVNQIPSGCRFHPRCSFATDQCRVEEPELINYDGRYVACWHTDEVLAKS
jgi:peptide/nickel transport system ATP-binding protein